MATPHWTSKLDRTASSSFGPTTVVAGRLLGEETPVETELTREGVDYEIVGDVLWHVTLPPLPRVARPSHAPIFPPPRRSLAAR